MNNVSEAKLVSSSSDVKPGWKTTEALAALIAAVPSILVALAALGVIGADDVATLEEAVITGLTALGTLIMSTLVLWKYIDGRTRVKEAAYGPVAEIEIVDGVDGLPK